MTQPVKTWAAKDPAAVLDYTYTIPLDAEDSIASIADVDFSVLDGTVAIDSSSLAAAPETDADGVYGQVLTAWLSGGADGETSMFKVAWTTVATRQDDAILLLPVVGSEYVALVLTRYAKPAPAHVVMKYPAFASVDAQTVQFWLTDAERYVTSAWSEGDYAAGLMALAAHNMDLAGLGADNSVFGNLPAGVSRIRSGSFDAAFTEQAANARLNGGYAATIYGQEYAALLARNRGGPLVAPSGVIPCGTAYPGMWPWLY